jgi:uroporphyrinogen-III synthase
MPERPRVAVVRVEDRADAVLEALRSAGGEPLLVPAMRIAPPSDDGALRAAVDHLSRYDAVVIGSVAAAEAVAARAAGAAYSGPVFCVGAQTRRRLDADPELRAVFSGPRVVPAQARAEGLEAALRMELSPLRGRRLLFPRAPEGRLHLVERLEASGAIVDAPMAYRIAAAEPLPEARRRELASVEAFLFFSGEAVRCFLEVAGPDAKELLEAAWVGLIGPAGAERARALGVRVDAFPEDPGAAALIDLWARARG